MPTIAERVFEEVDLTDLFNNIGATSSDHLGSGQLNVWRNSFPAEELPPGAHQFRPAGVPFIFPTVAAGRPDNMCCRGQRLQLPTAHYDWIYLLACSERRSEDRIYLHYASGTCDLEPFRVSDFWPEARPRFGEIEAVACSSMHFPRHVQPRVGPRIWQMRVPVTRQEALSAIVFPDNVAIHVFALTTLQSVVDVERASEGVA